MNASNNSTAKTLIYRVFEEPTGFFFCDDSLPHLDARGRCYPDRATATEFAIETGRQHERYTEVEFLGITGSGVCVETAATLDCPVL